MRMSSSRLLGGRFRALSDSSWIWLFCLCSGFNLYISTPCSPSCFDGYAVASFPSTVLFRISLNRIETSLRAPSRYEHLTLNPDGKGYDKWDIYASTETAIIQFTKEIAKRAQAKNEPVLAYSLCPGCE